MVLGVNRDIVANENKNEKHYKDNVANTLSSQKYTCYIK